MLQKFMDGKKKYSAFIITVLATMIPLFITESEAQQTFMDMVPSVAAALAGIFYIITQGKIDKEKEVAKAVNGNGVTGVFNHANFAGSPASAATGVLPSGRTACS